METVADLMAKWPTVADFGRDIGTKPTHAHTMKVRGAIPVEYWPKVIAAAETRGIDDVTADVLMRLHAPAPAESAAQ